MMTMATGVTGCPSAVTLLRGKFGEGVSVPVQRAIHNGCASPQRNHFKHLLQKQGQSQNVSAVTSNNSSVLLTNTTADDLRKCIFFSLKRVTRKSLYM